MPSSDFFERLGLFVDPNFLDPEFCADYLVKARSCICEPARLTRYGDAVTDDSRRKTGQLQIESGTIKSIRERLISIKPKLEAHFQIHLHELEPPSFYRYQVGDFFGLHRDVIDPDLPGSKFEKNRSVSLIVFLNSMSVAQRPDTFSGGALTLYALLDDPRSQNYGFPLEPEQGQLIAFRSDLWHEVKPVTHGERFSIVSWFI